MSIFHNHLVSNNINDDNNDDDDDDDQESNLKDLAVRLVTNGSSP